MTKSRADPKNREKTEGTAAEGRKKPRKDPDECAECIAKLERAIDTLKEFGRPETREKFDSAVKILQWAVAELRDSDPDAPIDPERIAAIDRLLRHCG